ncbi:putative bifunctional diguanylate cyclase/phosphodiesterase [Mycobacterium deserti]|uniref:EAL domain-containing protein n=1 Tax=Mycobacterium deserti TaxID=2978347 RepID=A0ABT2MBB8_9MYCO|nr:EAL domain-containing protein [Mycobacterium deserti]MCT7659573.1 EAL domain-containing protein [Mycobacterium deserti]
MVHVVWVAATATTAAVALVAWLIAEWGGPQTTEAAAMIGVLAFAVFAALSAVWAGWSSRGRQRLAWMCLAAGLGGWAFGEALWAYYRLVLHADPFPSIADVGYLLYPVGACAALLLFPLGHSVHSRTRLLLDGLIVVGALFVVAWVTVLRFVFGSGSESAFAAVLYVTYPATDVIVVTVALLILVRAKRPALVLLTLGNIVTALADSAWVYSDARNVYIEGGLVDVGWIVGLLLIGVAALASGRGGVTAEEVLGPPKRVELWMPYLPVAIAAAVCAPFLLTMSGVPPLVVSWALLVSAVMVRQFLVVNQNQRLLAIVAEQALRDPLTGLANRLLFHDRLSHAMQLQKREGGAVAVLLLDLDDFKRVNDSLGHPAGDALLVQVALRIVSCVRPGDTVARLGGDEFAVLTEGGPAQSRRIAHRVVRAFEEPFVVDGHALVIQPSAGLALVPVDDDSVSIEDLLKRADTAMYSAKRSTSGGLQTFTPDMSHVAANKRDSQGGLLLEELRNAIDNVDLTLAYQPKFDLDNGDIVGVEALIRWPHPELGVLAPDQFLPLVHRHGLVQSVTDLVVSRALDAAVEWRANGVAVPIAVNISAPSLSDLDFPNRIVRALAERGLTSDALTVEITEDLLVDNIDRAQAVLERLRVRGIRVAIDDFGSGYSALSYLRDLPIDEVKLDRHFVSPILTDTRAAAIVRAVIDLAHVLGVTTVAEGVENGETAAKLQEFGCDVVQGYYCGPPIDAAAMLDLLRRRGQRSSDGSSAGWGDAGTSRSEIELMQ